jgi:hypothetical protein
LAAVVRAMAESVGAGHAGAHEWKAGFDADFASVRETFSYLLTDPTQFDVVRSSVPDARNRKAALGECARPRQGVIMAVSVIA